jgi:5-hmdU DNA kinase, helical domain
MINPTPRARIYDLYWYFAAERLAMFQRRVAGHPAPWTGDPILAHYKFCNVYRASDRVSQYLIRQVAYTDPAAEPAEVFWRILAFRMFSKPETWETIIRHLGRPPRLTDLADGGLDEAVERARLQNGTIYTNAFILCANQAYGYNRKHLNHLALWRHMFLQDDLAGRLLEAGSLAQIYDLLRGYPLMGDFMSYQIAIDLNYSAHLNFDENDFTKAGPGARRGLDKAFVSAGSLIPEQIIHWMVEHQEQEFARLGLKFDGLWGRRLHAIDCQGLFCELDKYCRESAPELASNRVRIKAKYHASSRPLPLFFPPKWGLNQKLP